MSNTNGYQTLTKSMNGIIVLSDGAGTTISNGTVLTTNLDVVNLSTQNIVAPNLSTSSAIYTANTGNIFVGSNSDALFLKNLYTQTQGGIELLETTNPTAPFSFLSNNTNDIYIGSNSTPLVSDYVCTASNHLANKQYVDSVSGGGPTGGASLTATQTFLGVNTFNNNTNIGSTGQTSTVNIYGTVNIGNNSFSPGPDTNIYGDVITIQGLASTNLISNDIHFGNAGTPAVAYINIGNVGEVDLNFNTFSGNRNITTSQIVATNGTTANNGELALKAGTMNVVAPSINIGDSGYTSTIKLRGGCEIGDGYNIPAADTYIYGRGIYTSGASSMSGSTPKFSITNYGTLTSSFNVNTTTPSQIALEFNTNSATLSEITSKITATGTGLNAGTLTYNLGNFVVLANTNIKFSANTSVFVNNAATQTLEIDPATTASEVAIRFKTNTALPSTVTGSIITYGGTGTTNSGVMNLNASIIQNITSNYSVANTGANYSTYQVIPLSTGSIAQNFFTFITSPLTISSSITATGGTSTALQGTLALRARTITVNGSSAVNLDTNALTVTSTAASGCAITMTASITSDIYLTGYDGALPLPNLSKYPFYNGAPTISVYTAGNYNVKCTEKQYRALILIGYDAPTGVDIILDQNTASIIDGQEYMIWNMSAFAVTIKTNSSATVANLYKVGSSRGGTTFFNLAAGTGCYARAFTALANILMIPPSGINRGWIISMIT